MSPDDKMTNDVLGLGELKQHTNEGEDFFFGDPNAEKSIPHRRKKSLFTRLKLRVADWLESLAAIIENSCFH